MADTAPHPGPTPGADPFLHETDPGFVAYFDAWVRGESDVDSAVLGDRTRQLVRLASVVAAGGQKRFGVLAGGLLDLGLTPVALKEVLYQAVAYVGFATVSDFLATTNDLLRERGVELPLPEQSTTTPEDRLERGLAVQREVLGEDQVARMQAAATPDAAHLQRYLTGNVFGDVLARGGLTLAERELVTFAFLVGLGGADAQVRAHVAANLHVGNDRAVLLAVLTALVPAVGYPRVLNGLAALDAVTGPGTSAGREG